MSTIGGLRDRFSRQAKHINRYSKEDDPDLAALAKAILAESVGVDSTSPFTSPLVSWHGNAAQIESLVKESLSLLQLWLHNRVGPETFGVICTALLYGWAHTHDYALERQSAEALLGLSELSAEAQEQLSKALLDNAKRHLYYDTKKLLRLLGLLSPKSCETVARWAFRTLGTKAKLNDLLFAAACLQAVGNESVRLRKATVHHIESASRTLEIVQERLHFSEKPGIWKPMGEEILVLTATQVDCSWYTSDMGGLEKSVEVENQWLDFAEQQVLQNLGERVARGFGVDLVVHIYPYVEEWMKRRNELDPIKIISRSI